MAVAVPNSRPMLSHTEIEDILRTFTRTPAQILGEEPLGPLPPKAPRAPRLSYEAALAITRQYTDPLSVLGEAPLPSQLPPKRPRKRRLAADEQLEQSKAKKRKKPATYPALSATAPKSTASTSKSKKVDNRKIKVEPPIHKPLKVTVKLPKKAEPALRRSISPDGEPLPSKPKSEKTLKSSSSKERSKEPRREKDKLRLRSTPTPPQDAKEAKSAKIRSSPAPLSDSKESRKAKDRLSFRSSPAPPPDSKDTRRDAERPKSRASPASTSDSKEARKDTERPVPRYSPVHASEGKDSRKSSERSRRKVSPAESSGAKDTERKRLKSSPAKLAEAKETKRDTDKIKPQRSASRPSESKISSSKAPKKPPASVPLSRPPARIPRSEPAPLRSSSPEAAKKSDSAKLGAASRTSSAKERRGEKNMARRRESSVERSRREEKEVQRKRRESSDDSVPPRSKPRDSGKRRRRARDDDLSDDEQPVSRAGERERGSERDHDRLSDRDVLRGKSKEKERRALQDQRRSIDKDGDFEKSRRRDEIAHETDGYRERERRRDKDSEGERDMRRDGERERERERDRERLRSKVLEKTRDRGLKRDLERSGETEKERDRKTMRKEHGQESDAANRRSGEREDAPVSKTHQVHPRGPLGFRSEPVDKVLKNNRETRNDASHAQKERDRMKESTPRKSVLRLRSKPANAIKDSGAVESKPGEVYRNGKEAASPASTTHADPLPRPPNHTPTNEELRISAKQLEQLAADQRELLSQFDSLTKLCDDFLSKEKHDEFEETARSAFNVFFKFCLKKETEMRLRKRTHREWMETRKEVLNKYKYLAGQFGKQRISELEKLGRTRSSLFLSHQVYKIYVRIFILQRCWNKEQRSGENEMKSLMSYLKREGPAVDKNKVLTPRKIGHIASLLNDYANIVCLFDAIVSDWTDGDDQAGFEMTMPL